MSIINEFLNKDLEKKIQNREHLNKIISIISKPNKMDFNGNIFAWIKIADNQHFSLTLT